MGEGIVVTIVTVKRVVEALGGEQRSYDQRRLQSQELRTMTREERTACGACGMTQKSRGIS